MTGPPWTRLKRSVWGMGPPCVTGRLLVLFPPDPGLQPGSGTLPLKAGQRAGRLHMRQPQGQPSPSHGQRQQGQEVRLRSGQTVAAAVSMAACAVFSSALNTPLPAPQLGPPEFSPTRGRCSP